MTSPAMWDSLERMDRLFRRARATALICGGLGAAFWSIWLVVVAVPLSVAAFTAVLIMMFAWFRKEDIRQRQEMPPRR